MSLTAKQFTDIIETLRSDQHGRRAVEKRSAPRVGMRERVTVVLRPREPDSSIAVTWVRDVSANGLCLVYHEPVPVGTRFIAQFPGKAGKPLSVLYSVAHCKELTKGLYYLGARLVHILGDMQPDDWQKVSVAD